MTSPVEVTPLVETAQRSLARYIDSDDSAEAMFSALKKRHGKNGPAV